MKITNFLICSSFTLLSCNATTNAIPALPDRLVLDASVFSDASHLVDATVSDASVSTATQSAANLNSTIGINLEYAKDWVGHWPFVDTFKLARTWIPQQVSPEIWDCRSEACAVGHELSLTPEGWIASLKPNQAVGTLLFINHDGHFPVGRYTVLYDGEGTLRFSWDARVITRIPGKIIIEVTPSPAGIYIQQTSTNSQNPLRNIKVIMPSFESTHENEPFHPLFLHSLSKFKIIRFQHWHVINEQYDDEAVITWEDLPPLQSFQSTWRGVHPVWMIKLANELSADAWFHIPHKADDDFVYKFATLVKKELRSDLKVYIEYSNEVWNYAFPQSQYAGDEGMRLGLSHEHWEANLRFYSERSVEIFDIWRQVFANDDRLVCVLAGQAANPWHGAYLMDWKQAFQKADVYATAPYIAGEGGTTVTEILDNLEKDISVVMQKERENFSNANTRGLKHITYEGGQHLIGFDQQNRALFLEANRHPRMKEIYLDYLSEWFKISDGPFVHYTYVMIPSEWGAFGALEYQDQLRGDAPKYDALLTFIENQQK